MSKTKGVIVHIPGCLCVSVVLLQSGEVYTFGSNQYGQLGQGDTAVK